MTRLEWFLEDAVRPRIVKTLLVHRIGHTRQQQDGYGAQVRLLSHPARQLVAVDAGHVGVGQHQVRPLRRHPVDGVLTVLGDHHADRLIGKGQ